MIPVLCEICGSIFMVKPSHVYRRKTCSRACVKTYKSVKFSGENNHQYGLKGSSNSSFKGKITYKNGYAYIYIPDHPYGFVNGRVKYHRYLAEMFLDIPNEYKDDNGYLLPEFDVHHKDGNKLNNALDNLEVMTRSIHTTLHNKSKQILRDKETGRIIGVLKQGELLESCNANQQPSLDRNILEGSTTNSRVLPGNAEDSNADTSALHYFYSDDIV